MPQDRSRERTETRGSSSEETRSKRASKQARAAGGEKRKEANELPARRMFLRERKAAVLTGAAQLLSRRRVTNRAV